MSDEKPVVHITDDPELVNVETDLVLVGKIPDGLTEEQYRNQIALADDVIDEIIEDEKREARPVVGDLTKHAGDLRDEQKAKRKKAKKKAKKRKPGTNLTAGGMVKLGALTDRSLDLFLSIVRARTVGRPLNVDDLPVRPRVSLAKLDLIIVDVEGQEFPTQLGLLSLASWVTSVSASRVARSWERVALTIAAKKKKSKKK